MSEYHKKLMKGVKMIKSAIQRVIDECKFVMIDERVRLYYKVCENKTGFDFYVIEVCHESVWERRDWEYRDVRVMAFGYAIWNGLLNFYLGDNGNGSLHYPDLDAWMRVFGALKELMREHCQEILVKKL